MSDLRVKRQVQKTARTAFARASLGDAPLEPTRYAALGKPTQRPMFSALENTTFGALGIAPLPPWQDALDEFLAARSARLLSAQ